MHEETGIATPVQGPQSKTQVLHQSEGWPPAQPAGTREGRPVQDQFLQGLSLPISVLDSPEDSLRVAALCPWRVSRRWSQALGLSGSTAQHELHEFGCKRLHESWGPSVPV